MDTPKKNRWIIIGDEPVVMDERHYCADPFFLEYLFFEYYDYNKGVIAIKNGDKTEIVLERPYHLSFPCVFKDKGEYYMLPETVNNGQLELYKANNFPYDWELVKVIATGWYDDPIMYINNGYHIFTTKGANNLVILRSNSLDEDFVEVYNDSSKQYRSAGKIFTANNKTIRPCQDCEGGYGKGLIFYELEGYNHWPISRFSLPSPFTGCHTYNEGYIDARLPYETNLDFIKQITNLRRQIPYTN